jgi:hypothetical protein
MGTFPSIALLKPEASTRSSVTGIQRLIRNNRIVPALTYAMPVRLHSVTMGKTKHTKTPVDVPFDIFPLRCVRAISASRLASAKV